MGKVFLVGAGPGDPELLTVKAMRLLQSAEVVLYDGLVSEPALALVSPLARRIFVGKRCGQRAVTQEQICAMLVYYAGVSATVVRLKGGDPAIFGRTGEEIDELRRAGVEFEIVPGITSASAAAAAAGTPLTDRRVTSHLIFTTAHRAIDAQQDDWTAVRESGGTLAIYMPGDDYPRLSRALLQAGIAPETPCVLVSHASRPEQNFCWTDVAHLAAQPAQPAPALLLVGEVLRSAAEADARHAAGVMDAQRRLMFPHAADHTMEG